MKKRLGLEILLGVDYANELLVLVRLTFQKIQKQYETIKNKFWLSLSIVWKTDKLTRYRGKEFSHTLSTEQSQDLRVQLARADIIHSQREI